MEVAEGSTCLERCDVFQLDGATFVLLTHAHDSGLEDFTGLQNEHLARSRTSRRLKRSRFLHYLLTAPSTRQPYVTVVCVYRTINTLKVPHYNHFQIFIINPVN